MNLTAILGVMLTLSIMANGWLFHQRDKAIAAEATAAQLNNDTKNAAKACTDSVNVLVQKGDERQTRLEAALKSIAPKVAQDQRSALSALNAKADNVADLCGSLQRYWQGEIKRDRESNP